MDRFRVDKLYLVGAASRDGAGSAVVLLGEVLKDA